MKNQVSVQNYIESAPMASRERLEIVRAMIQELAPDAVESIAYGMPAYKLLGKPLVYFAGYEHHVGFYAIPSAHTHFASRLSPYKQGKGSVQFPHDQPLPEALIRDMIVFRIKENREKYSGKAD